MTFPHSQQQQQQGELVWDQVMVDEDDLAGVDLWGRRAGAVPGSGLDLGLDLGLGGGGSVGEDAAAWELDMAGVLDGELGQLPEVVVRGQGKQGRGKQRRRELVVLPEGPMRAALDQAEAEQRLGVPAGAGVGALGGGGGGGSSVAAEHVLLSNWRAHVAARFPDLYDAEWHGGLFDFLFDLWLAVGKALAALPGGGADGGRGQLDGAGGRMDDVYDYEYDNDEEEYGSTVAAGSRSGETRGLPQATQQQQEKHRALVDSAFKLASECAASPHFAVRSALAVSVLDCMADHPTLTRAFAWRLPVQLVQKVVWPLVHRLQPGWVLEEWEEELREAHPGLELHNTPAKPWQLLMEQLERRQVVHPAAGLGVVMTALDVDWDPRPVEERRAGGR